MIGAKTFDVRGTIHLSEIVLEPGNEWIGKQLAEIEFEPDKLVALVYRRGKIMIPSGKTTLREGDVVILNQPEAPAPVP